MPRSPEQRAAANRANAKKSTGPTSREGKLSSSKNAFQHGMRAVTPMPDEDPALLEAREQQWNDYYRPDSPAAEHLVKQCVRATVMADHCQTYHDAVVAQQVREATERWDCTRQDEVDALAAKLSTDPASASAALRRTAQGCDYLVARWDELRIALLASGYWTSAQAVEAVHLQGFSARRDTLKGCPGAWLTLAYSVACRPGEGDPLVAVKWLCDVQIMPEEFARPESEAGLPEPARCRELLLEMVEGEQSMLTAESQRLAREIDGPARAAAVGRAYMPAESPQTRLYLRYQAESRLAFHRAYDSLTKTLKQEGERAASHEEDREAAAPLPAVANSPQARGENAGRRGRPLIPERSHLENSSPHVERVEAMEDRESWQAEPAGAVP
jgi:hypothetical protein